jgi:hypothetical protein
MHAVRIATSATPPESRNIPLLSKSSLQILLTLLKHLRGREFIYVVTLTCKEYFHKRSASPSPLIHDRSEPDCYSHPCLLSHSKTHRRRTYRGQCATLYALHSIGTTQKDTLTDSAQQQLRTTQAMAPPCTMCNSDGNMADVVRNPALLSSPQPTAQLATRRTLWPKLTTCIHTSTPRIPRTVG